MFKLTVISHFLTLLFLFSSQGQTDKNYNKNLWHNIEREIRYQPDGEDFVITHTWTNQGDYTVRVKAKDTEEAESEWATFDTTMPRSKILYMPIFGLLERVLQFFPSL